MNYSNTEVPAEPVWAETVISLSLTTAQNRIFKEVIIRGEGKTVENFPGYTPRYHDDNAVIEGVTPVVLQWVYALRQFAKETEERSDKTIATRLANKLAESHNERYNRLVKNRHDCIHVIRKTASGAYLRTFVVEISPIQFGYRAIARTYSYGGDIKKEDDYDVTHYSTEFNVLPDTSGSTLRWAVGKEGLYLEMGSRNDGPRERKGTFFEDLDEAKEFAISLATEASETLRLQDIETQERAITSLQNAGLGLEE